MKIIFHDFNIRHRAVGTCCVFRGVGEAAVCKVKIFRFTRSTKSQGSKLESTSLRGSKFKVEVEGWRLEVGGWRLEVGGWRLEVGVPTPTSVMFLRGPPPSLLLTAWPHPPLGDLKSIKISLKNQLRFSLIFSSILAPIWAPIRTKNQPKIKQSTS